MNPRTTAILFAVAVLLGAFVFFYELRGGRDARDGRSGRSDRTDRKGAQSDLETRRVFPGLSLESDGVESLSFTTEEGTPARVEKREGRWRLIEPVDAPADQAAIDTMVSTLVNLSGEGVIEQPQQASVYGLDDAARSLRFRAGGIEYGLRLGGKTPVGANSYVTATGSDRVFIVPTWKINSLAHSLFEVRDRRVLPFDPAAVEHLRVSWPGGGVTVVRTSAEAQRVDFEGVWRVVSPALWRADDSAIDTLLSDLSFLRAESFVDGELADTEAGLAAPVFEVTLTLAPGVGGPESHGQSGAVALEFALGRLVGASDRVARGLSGALFRVSETLMVDLPRRLVDYRYKELSHFELSEASSIELSFHPPGPGGSIELRMARTEEGWKATTKEGLAAGMASRLVAELAQLKAVDIVAESMGRRELAALGLSPPHASFRVYGKPGEDGKPGLLCDVQLGDADPRQGILARSAGNDTVYRLDFALADEIPINYGEFADTFASKATAASDDEASSGFEPGVESGVE